MSSQVTAWVAVGVSGGALITSILALAVAYANYRASGPRITITSHALRIQSSEDWLEIVLANAGRSDVDIEGAWSNWLGSSITELPRRLSAGSSCSVLFRGVMPPPRLATGPLTVSVGLGSGGTLLKRIELSEAEQGQVNWRQHEANRGTSPPRNPSVQSSEGQGDSDIVLPTDEV